MSAGTARTLLVLRHAKAADQPRDRDWERPLTGRGRRDAGAAGRWLRESGLAPDTVLCSDAVRATQTWEQVRAGLSGAADRTGARFDPRIYHAGAQALLGLVREEIPGGSRAALIVGHNPAAHQLAVDLTGRADLAFPTAALAVISFAGSWAGLGPGGGELVAFWSPRLS